MTVAASAVARITDAAAWDGFVAGSPQGSVFCRTGFLDALDRPYELWRFGADAWQAAAILFREPDGRIATAPLPFTMYQGVLLDGDITAMPTHRRVLETLGRVQGVLDGLEDLRSLSFCLHPELIDLRAFSWFHYDLPELGQFRLDLRYTGLIPLDPDRGRDGFLDRCTTLRRRDCRKAASRFTVEASGDVGLLDALHGATFARQGVARSERERSLLRSIAAAAIDGGFGELLVARAADGRAAGAVLFLFDDRAAYYLIGANDPDFRASGASTLLFVAGAERAMARGARMVDVVGMNSPRRGDFKASFGAVPAPYVVASWSAPPAGEEAACRR
jgi:hypothetical protein